jgi:hypothetical protein
VFQEGGAFSGLLADIGQHLPVAVQPTPGNGPREQAAERKVQASRHLKAGSDAATRRIGLRVVKLTFAPAVNPPE